LADRPSTSVSLTEPIQALLRAGPDRLPHERRHSAPRGGEKNDERVQRCDSLLVMGAVRLQRVAGLSRAFAKEERAVPDTGEVPFGRPEARLVEVKPPATGQRIAEMGIAVHGLLGQLGRGMDAAAACSTAPAGPPTRSAILSASGRGSKLRSLPPYRRAPWWKARREDPASAGVAGTASTYAQNVTYRPSVTCGPGSIRSLGGTTSPGSARATAIVPVTPSTGLTR